MTKIPVSELEGPLLAEFVARVWGWKIDTDEITGWDFYYDDGFPVIKVDNYRPYINGKQAMELVTKFDIGIGKVSSSKWEATAWNDGNSYERYGETPEVAICRAVIASVYGMYVDDAV